MHPSCLVSSVQTSGGSIMVWACLIWSGLCSAALYDQITWSADFLNVLNDPNGTFKDGNTRIGQWEAVKSCSIGLSHY